MDRTYFAETENWKYCSKIIFKCVNSVVGPIFNEKVVEKCNFIDHIVNNIWLAQNLACVLRT